MRLMTGVLAASAASALALAAGAAQAERFGGAQRDPPPAVVQQCPTVTVSCPDVSRPGGTLTFTANVSGGDPRVTPTFDWTVSSGTISGGQGTSSVTVKVVSVPGPCGESYTGTVEVGGYDRSCLTSGSCTIMDECPPMARKIDEYGNVNYGSERARLDNLAIELQNDPTSRGHLICYGGRRDAPDAARRRCERARNYLVSARRISASRLFALDGGRREEQAVEFWLAPAGASPPQLTPTVFPDAPQRPSPARRPGRGRGHH